MQPADPFALDATALVFLSESDAVRRRYDARNRKALPAVLWILALFFFGAFVGSSEKDTNPGMPAAAAGFLLCLAWLFLLYHLGPGRRRFRVGWLAARAPRIAPYFGAILRSGLLGLFVLALLWAVAIGDNPSFLFLAAIVLLVFRFPPLTVLSLHAVVLLAALPVAWLSELEDAIQVLIGAAVVHAFCATLGIYLSRRFRRRFLAEWRRTVTDERERIRVREELALARDVQLSMLPESVPSLPWLDVAAACLPAAEVGGDYYDFFPDADGGSLAVAVGDVAGHGLASGLVLATVRAGLALLMDTSETPQVALPRLDRLVRGSRRRMLVTLALVRFDRRSRRVTVTTAGHPPVLVRRAGGRIEELATPAPPLGTRLGHAPRPLTTEFAPGDCFLMFTDGLTEAPDGDGREYGQERLAARLAEHPEGGTAAELCADVLADLYRHRGEAPQEDDLTLVALVAR